MPAKPLLSYTRALTGDQASRLRQVLERDNFDFVPKEHTYYAATNGKVSVAEVVAARSARLEARDRNGDGKIGADESAHRGHAKRGCKDSGNHDAHASGDAGN